MEKLLQSRLSFVALVVTALIFSGCSSKQYFEPEQTFSADAAASSYGGTIVDQSRDGATLKSGRYIGKSGISKINLGQNYRFLSESNTYVLAGSVDGKLNRDCPIAAVFLMFDRQNYPLAVQAAGR